MRPKPEIVAASEGGFESLADGAAPGPDSGELSFSEEPSFSEDPVFEEAPLEIEGATNEDPPSSPEIVLDMEPPEAPEVVEPEVESLEIEAEAPVLEVEPMVLSAESAPEVEVESEPEEDLVLVDPSSVEVIEVPEETTAAAQGTPLVDDDPVVIADESTLEIPEEDVGLIVPGEEMEVVEFQLDEEPENSEEESAALLGALGEDIDSMIDSIISDVGSPSIVETEDDGEPPTHIPLFSDLTTPEFIDVALLLVRRVFKPGEVAVREGDPGDSMFIISTGEVRATVDRDGQQLPVATLRDGDFFGEMAVLTGEPRTATVTAVKNTEVLELNRENLQIICSRHPHVEAKIRLSYDERVSNSPI